MKIMLAEDSGLLRDSLSGMLRRQGIEVISQCDSATQLLSAVAGHPDVDVVVTLSLCIDRVCWMASMMIFRNSHFTWLVELRR